MNDEPAASNLGDKHATHSDPYLHVNSVNANDPEFGVTVNCCGLRGFDSGGGFFG
jgi:hypothetical protein